MLVLVAGRRGLPFALRRDWNKHRFARAEWQPVPHVPCRLVSRKTTEAPRPFYLAPDPRRDPTRRVSPCRPRVRRYARPTVRSALGVGPVVVPEASRMPMPTAATVVEPNVSLSPLVAAGLVEDATAGVALTPASRFAKIPNEEAPRRLNVRGAARSGEDSRRTHPIASIPSRQSAKGNP